ncbi:hypothetical protein BJX99DRAFT_257075 [Aspergillus californicus]
MATQLAFTTRLSMIISMIRDLPAAQKHIQFLKDLEDDDILSLIIAGTPEPVRKALNQETGLKFEDLQQLSWDDTQDPGIYAKLIYNPVDTNTKLHFVYVGSATGQKGLRGRKASHESPSYRKRDSINTRLAINRRQKFITLYRLDRPATKGEDLYVNRQVCFLAEAIFASFLGAYATSVLQKTPSCPYGDPSEVFTWYGACSHYCLNEGIRVPKGVDPKTLPTLAARLKIPGPAPAPATGLQKWLKVPPKTLSQEPSSKAPQHQPGDEDMVDEGEPVSKVIRDKTPSLHPDESDESDSSSSHPLSEHQPPSDDSDADEPDDSSESDEKSDESDDSNDTDDTDDSDLSESELQRLNSQPVKTKTGESSKAREERLQLARQYHTHWRRSLSIERTRRRLDMAAEAMRRYRERHPEKTREGHKRYRSDPANKAKERKYRLANADRERKRKLDLPESEKQANREYNMKRQRRLREKNRLANPKEPKKVNPKNAAANSARKDARDNDPDKKLRANLTSYCMRSRQAAFKILNLDKNGKGIMPASITPAMEASLVTWVGHFMARYDFNKQQIKKKGSRVTNVVVPPSCFNRIKTDGSVAAEDLEIVLANIRK